MRDFFDPIQPAQMDWSNPIPRAVDFDDGYYGQVDGIQESHCVFIEGNDLPKRFSQLQANEVFVIGETGFGTGLNVLLAAQTFVEHAHPKAILHIVSADLHPLCAQDFRRACAAWSSLRTWVDPLISQYPPAAPGHHRVWLAPNIELTLMWGDAAASFHASTACVNAWFLDGFSPAHNPKMWSSELFEALSARSAPAATLASFTAAGHVRRGLGDVGFVIEKKPGFGGKRHRIVGRKPGMEPHKFMRTGHAIIVGAGLAGATTARALAMRGWSVEVNDPNPPASGASGNLAGVVYATPSPHLQAQNRFYLTALIRSLGWFHALGFPTDPENGQLSDVLLHLKQARRKKNAQLAHSTGAWPSDLLSLIDENTACLHGAGYIRPSAWVHHLLDHPNINHQAKKINSVRDQQGVVVLANAQDAMDFDGLQDLPLKAIRGQVTQLQATPESMSWQQAQCHVGYLTPAIDGQHCIGATYDLHGEHTGVVDKDDVHNIEQLKTHLPKAWQALGGENLKIIDRRAAYRCTTPDRLPLVGNVESLGPDVWLNIGHGSRGITHTPVCAELLADWICQTNQTAGLGVDATMADALSPSRYLEKATKS